MTDALGDFEKRTGSGGHFIIRFFSDGSLIEWDASETSEQGWHGSWSSGAVKYDHVTTSIGSANVRYESDGYEMLLGNENGISCSIKANQSQVSGLQGYPK